MTRWSGPGGGGGDGESYAARFTALATAGVDVHGEATLCSRLVPPPARVLDAGCGTGRVAIRLAELGYDCAGVDLDASMLGQARASAPAMTWLLADLAGLDLPAHGVEGDVDLVVAAGNVMPLVAEGSEERVIASLAGCLRPGGLIVTGFGLDAAHLPAGAAFMDLDRYDAMCSAAGLAREQRWATWDRTPYEGGGYAVTVSRRQPG